MITGFPSPAQGYEDNVIDLNELLVKHPAATVFMRMDSSRYVHAGIYDGDLLVVDRALRPSDGSLVVCEREGRFVLGVARDVAEGCVVCGVVTYVIHTVRGVSCGNGKPRRQAEGPSGGSRASSPFSSPSDGGIS